VASQERRARKLLDEHDYEPAIPILTKLAALKEPPHATVAVWAKKELPVVKQKHEQLQVRAANACEKARALLKRYEYATAVQELELIPKAARSPELRQLLSQATDLHDDLIHLQEEIKEAVTRKKLDGVLPLVRRFLKLKPDHPKMLRLARDLERNRAERAVANYRGTRRYVDVAGRLIEPKELALCVFAILALFAAVTYGLRSYIASSQPVGDTLIPITGTTPGATQQVTTDTAEIGKAEPTFLKDDPLPDVQTSQVASPEVKATAGQEPLTLKGHTGIVLSVAFSADGTRLVSASADQTVKVWDATSGQETLTLKGHSKLVFSAVFNDDGKRLASASVDQTVKVWDATSGLEAITLRGHTDQVTSVAFSKDGAWLASASLDRTVKIWDATSGRETIKLNRLNSPSYCVAFSADGKRLAAASSDEKTVKVWDTKNGLELLTLIGHTAQVNCVAFNADGTRLVSASYDKTVKLWDTASGQEMLTLTGHTGPVYGVAFSPDGKRLASSGSDPTVKLWDATSGQETLTLTGHAGPVYSVAFNPDGKRLASASEDQTVRLWDVSSLAKALDGNDGWVSLFNGKDLKGWGETQTNTKKWLVESGVVVAPFGPKLFAIATEKTFDEYELEVEYRPTNAADSGVGLFATPSTSTGWGYQWLEVNGDGKTIIVGNKIIEGASFKPGAYQANDWNRVSISNTRKEGLVVQLNGVLTSTVPPAALETALAKSSFKRNGAILLQSWNGKVEYRNIRIKELSNTAVALATVSEPAKEPQDRLAVFVAGSDNRLRQYDMKGKLLSNLILPSAASDLQCLDDGLLAVIPAGGKVLLIRDDGTIQTLISHAEPQTGLNYPHPIGVGFDRKSRTVFVGDNARDQLSSFPITDPAKRKTVKRMGTKDELDNFRIEVLDTGVLIVSNSEAGVVTIPNLGTGTLKIITKLEAVAIAARPGSTRWAFCCGYDKRGNGEAIYLLDNDKRVGEITLPKSPKTGSPCRIYSLSFSSTGRLFALLQQSDETKTYEYEVQEIDQSTKVFIPRFRVGSRRLAVGERLRWPDLK
jgi:WD40 repeat protein